MKHVTIFVLLFAMATTGYAQPAIYDNAVTGSGAFQHNYVGTWIHNPSVSGFYLGSLSYSSVTNNYVSFVFTGNKIEWYTEKKPTHGIGAISIDNGPETMIDLYSPTEQHVVVFTSATLTQGEHTAKVRVTGSKNAASTGYYILHDYFGVYQEVAQPAPNTNTSFGEGTIARGTENSAFGYGSMGGGASTGSSNSAFGAYSLQSYDEGVGNTAIGYGALRAGTRSSSNTAIGANTLPDAARSPDNTAVGYGAIGQGTSYLTSGNTGIGAHALDIAEPGSGNTALGAYAGISGTDFITGSTAVGASAKVTASNQVRIGGGYVTNIGGPVSWSTLSDGRLKQDIRNDVAGLKFINALVPVSYTVDRELLRKFLGTENDSTEMRGKRMPPSRHTGFIAQDVDRLVKRSGFVFYGVDAPRNTHDLYSIRYAEFVVPLVKAVQELTVLVEEQQAMIQEQQLKIETLIEKFNGIPGIKTESTKTSLLQNTPNPFTDVTQIRMAVAERANRASILIFSLDGKQVKELPVTGRGDTAVSLAGTDLAAGMYLYSLIVDGEIVDTKRMVLSK